MNSKETAARNTMARINRLCWDLNIPECELELCKMYRAVCRYWSGSNKIQLDLESCTSSPSPLGPSHTLTADAVVYHEFGHHLIHYDVIGTAKVAVTLYATTNANER